MNAPMWTHEEISMIQELFPEPMDVSMVSSKDLVISDVFISDSTPVKFEAFTSDSAASCTDNDPVTEVLLSPVGSEESIEQCFADETDAMTAFSMEAIDPFDSIVATITPAAVAPHSRGKEQVLESLRSKVDALTKMYYTRCARLLGGLEGESDTAMDIEKIKLVHVIEKLKRVSMGLIKENERLAKEAARKRQAVYIESTLESIRNCIDEQMCMETIEKAVLNATTFAGVHSRRSESGENMGWRYKSMVADDGFYSFSIEKSYPAIDLTLEQVIDVAWGIVTKSEKFSSIYYGSIRATVLKELNENAAVMVYDFSSKDGNRIDRILTVLHRVTLPNGAVLIGARTIHPDALAEIVDDSVGVDWMKASSWQIYELRPDNTLLVTSQGELKYPTKADAQFMAIELLCMHVRWEQTTFPNGSFRLL